MDDVEGRLFLESGTWSRARRLSFDGLSLVSVGVHGGGWFDRCTFAGSDLRQATFDGAHFKMCSFRGARMRGASLRGVTFGGCDLRDVDLRDADLTGAHFGYVNSGRIDVGRTDLTGARLAGAITNHVVLEQVIGWPESL